MSGRWALALAGGERSKPLDVLGVVQAGPIIAGGLLHLGGGWQAVSHAVHCSTAGG